MATTQRRDLFAEYRTFLRDLRARHGRFADETLARAELEAMAALFPPGSLQRQIFTAAEIEREPLKKIASRLGVSERHLYRIRREALNVIAHSASLARVSPSIDRAASTLEKAERALSHGDARQSRAIIERALQGDFPSSLLPDALSTHVRALSTSGEFRVAEETLDDARRIAGENHPAVQVAHASIPYANGRYADAIRICDATRESAIVQEPWSMRAQARRLFFHAVLHQEGGDAQRAIELIDRCEALLRRLPIEPAAELTQVNVLRAFTFGAIPGRMPEARRAADAATASSLWHGLSFELAWSQITQAWLRAGTDAAAEAMDLADQAVAVARMSAFGDQSARILMSAARVANMNGDVKTALERVRLAESAAKDQPWILAVTRMMHVRTIRKSASADTVIEVAGRCIERYEHLNNTAYLGAPRLARAAAFLQKGIAEPADIERALSYFERGAPLADQIEAYKLSYKITKNRRHAALARELDGYANDARTALRA